MSLRFLIAPALCLSIVLGFAAPASAEVVDKGPPYTNDQFVEISKERVPDSFKYNLDEWWAKAPGYLKQRILAARSEMWWAIILCNYQGFAPGASGRESAETCEKNWYKNSQRGKSFWSPTGEFVGPGEACIKRDKRTQYGELICD